MKFIRLLVLLFAVMLIPLGVKAEEYASLNFKEALKDEGIKEAFKSYKETDDQVTIYLFRGKGCSYCRAYLTFMNSITDEYGKYFKMVSYEVWNNQTNASLLNIVAAVLKEPVEGVPYIVIGDKVFGGYASVYDEDIKKTIVDLYNTKKKDRYDVMNHLDEVEISYNDEETSSNDTRANTTEEYSNQSAAEKDISNGSILIWSFIFILVATAINIIFVNYKFNLVLSKIKK